MVLRQDKYVVNRTKHSIVFQGWFMSQWETNFVMCFVLRVTIWTMWSCPTSPGWWTLRWGANMASSTKPAKVSADDLWPPLQYLHLPSKMMNVSNSFVTDQSADISLVTKCLRSQSRELRSLCTNYTVSYSCIQCDSQTDHHVQKLWRQNFDVPVYLVASYL